MSMSKTANILILALAFCLTAKSAFTQMGSSQKRQEMQQQQQQENLRSEKQQQQTEKSDRSRTESKKIDLSKLKSLKNVLSQQEVSNFMHSIFKDKNLNVQMNLALVENAYTHHIKDFCNDLKAGVKNTSLSIVKAFTGKGNLELKIGALFNVDPVKKSINGYYVNSVDKRYIPTNDSFIAAQWARSEAAYKIYGGSLAVAMKGGYNNAMKGAHKMLASMSMKSLMRSNIESRGKQATTEMYGVQQEWRIQNTMSGKPPAYIREYISQHGDPTIRMGDSNLISYKSAMIKQIIHDAQNDNYSVAVPDLADYRDIFRRLDLFEPSSDIVAMLSVYDNRISYTYFIKIVVADLLIIEAAVKGDRAKNEFYFSVDTGFAAEVSEISEFSEEEQRLIIQTILEILEKQKFNELLKPAQQLLLGDLVMFDQVGPVSFSYEISVDKEKLAIKGSPSFVTCLSNYDVPHPCFVIQAVNAYSQIENLLQNESLVYSKESLEAMMNQSFDYLLAHVHPIVLDQQSGMINGHEIKYIVSSGKKIDRQLSTQLSKQKSKEISKNYSMAISRAQSRNDSVGVTKIRTLALALLESKLSQKQFINELNNALSVGK